VQNSRLRPDTIVAAAIALLNEEGLDGVSLRNLAARLGVKAPSLYWHFSDKSALLSAVMESVFNRGLDSVPPHAAWKDWMLAFGKAMWKAQLTTRDFSRLVTTTHIDAAQLERTRARIRAALSHLNLDIEEAMRIQSSIQALVMGWSAFAHAPYAADLARHMNFKTMAMNDLALLIAGESMKIDARARGNPKRAAKNSR
jgi:TetR/AcrR family transcriptional regulator, tetracycline repressor protein